MGKGLSDLLCRPRSGRGVPHVEVYDLAAVMKQDHEHVEHAKLTVGATKKSTETRSATWFWRKVRQVCEGGFARRGTSRPTVRCEMLRPSLRSSPWMRGAPVVCQNSIVALDERLASSEAGAQCPSYSLSW